MTDEDGLCIEAAEQFGFEWTTGAIDGYICTKAQLLAFAKSCERRALVEARLIAGSELRNTGHLLSNPPQSAAAWDIRNAITCKIEALDTQLAPILAAEEDRFMTAQGYVRGTTDEPGTRWVRPATAEDLK